MRAGTHEVHIPVARMPVGWPEIGHLGQRMSQPVSCAFHQIISIAPRDGGIRLFELDVRFEIGDAQHPDEEQS